MILPPSKKIFIGSSSVLTGVVLQMVLSWLYGLSLEAVQSGRAANGANPGDIDRKLEQLHQQMTIGVNGLTASWIFLIVGIILLLTGVYQNARATEALEQRLNNGPAMAADTAGKPPQRR
ncbi:MAG: hypothetical protein EOP86_13735 [Verrucomicrobiaceae bacterium]|nr:MAG: hypothetical protein EOP86_13735 [Verrucomicrobiaceae bacterium]